MTQIRFLTRREALKTAAVGALALPLFNTSAWSAEKSAGAPKSGAGGDWENGLRLGVATYSTRMMPLDDSIAVLKAVRIKTANVFKAHCNFETATVDECKAVLAKFTAAGITLNGTGVTNLPNDEAKIRRAFENARAVNLPVLVCKPVLEALPLVHKLVKEYDQKLAIHNHGPEDAIYPSPLDVWKAVQSYDARIGLCIDVSHTLRAGASAPEAIKAYASRLYDVHLKDTQANVGAKVDIPIEQGAGKIDTRGILRALLDVKYAAVVTYEYEREVANPAIGLAESLGYLRGMLKAMA